jgi:hypothetical protein
MWSWHIMRHFHRILLERLRLENGLCRKLTCGPRMVFRKFLSLTEDNHSATTPSGHVSPRIRLWDELKRGLKHTFCKREVDGDGSR